MHPKYESPFSPSGPDQLDQDPLTNLSVTELKNKEASLQTRLEKLRKEEPANKRANRDKYVLWVKQTQDLIFELGKVRDALTKKQLNNQHQSVIR